MICRRSIWTIGSELLIKKRHVGVFRLAGVGGRASSKFAHRPVDIKVRRIAKEVFDQDSSGAHGNDGRLARLDPLTYAFICPLNWLHIQRELHECVQHIQEPEALRQHVVTMYRSNVGVDLPRTKMDPNVIHEYQRHRVSHIKISIL